MDFFIDLENFLSKRRIPLKHIILMCAFLFFALISVVIGAADGNYGSVITVMITGAICFSFSKEIKKIHEHNHLITYQKNVATSGFDASLFAFFVFSKNGKCIFVNRTAQNLFPGLKIRTIEDFIFCFGKYPKVVEAIRNLQIAAENVKQSHIDIPIKLHTDNPAIWRIAVSPIPGHQGYSGWTIIDLTPSSVKIESLETNSRFLLEIINGSTVGYFCLNSENEIIFCNITFANWLGKKVDDILGNVFSRYILKEKSEELPSHSGKLTGALPARISLKMEGNSCEVIVRFLPLTRDGNRVFLVTQDHQQGSDIIQALGKTKLYFEHIFEDAPVGIVITDGAEVIRAYNHTFQTLAGFSNDEGPNPSLLDHIYEEDREAVREKLYQLLSVVHKSVAPFELRFRTQEKRTVMVYITKIDIAKRTQSLDSLIMYFIDITERKKLQHQFVQSQKMQAVGQLAGGIAHDFNNLLTAMIGYCDLLLEKFTPSDQAFNDVIQIKQNANRAANLVRQLLAFSRQQTMEPQISRIVDMINELSALLKRLLGAKIELKVIHERDSAFIKVDQVQFEQVIINLAVNARDAMKDGGTLTIRTMSYSSKEPKFLRGETMPSGDYILIEVSDTGCGIEEQNLNRIFDPFFSSKEKGHGTGLGLSTVYGIVNQSGGFVSVDSEIGSGTRFSLYFPVVSAEEYATKERKEKSSDSKVMDLTGVGTILLVEDEDAVRMFSSRALREKGYNVIETSNGEAALECIKKGGKSIDIVITDVIMPKMDGPTLMKHIKEYNSNLKVIFISGYIEDSFSESLRNEQNVYFLAKPFNLKELAGKVKDVMSATYTRSKGI
ncbi:MAG: response regulator [Holosporaceae bacterium]|jgi:two-component system cell cycle sensor histidine kinase/response regulator CckA|nr:response regulator [Holosporaceae bacterium]